MAEEAQHTMTPHLTRPTWSRRARALVAPVTLALFASVLSGSAMASPGSGEVSLSLKPGSSLLKQGVKVTYGAKAGKTGSAKRIVLKGKRGSAGKAERVDLPVDDLVLGDPVTVGTEGGLSLALNGEKVFLADVSVRVGTRSSALRAKLGKKRLVVFRAKGTATIGTTSVSLSKAKLSLTGRAARLLRNKLDLDSLTAGKLGTLSVDAKLDALPPTPTPPSPAKSTSAPIGDPYSAQCPLPATSEAKGNATPAAAGTVLAGADGITEGTIGWGFKQSFRTYLVTAAGGSATGIAPATVLAPPPGPPQAGTFEFPAAAGQYLANTSDPADDQAVIEGDGEVVLCAFHEGKGGFRITLSNPTVTIDGVNSRLAVDVSTNLAGTVVASQRVDLATIEPVDPTYASSPESVTWTNMPTKLTQAGLDATGLSKFYAAGQALDPLTVEINEPWPFTAACDLSGIDPMPAPTTTPSWPAAPSGVPSLPTLTSPDAIGSGGVSWGVRNSLRNTVNGTGIFNLSGGATSSHSIATKQMGGEGKFFTWPAVSGEYEEPALPIEPGRLVLQGTGTVGICQTHSAQAYGTVLSNPTLIIDGADSRLVMDVSTVFRTSWTSFDSIDVASLAIGAVEKTTTPGPGLNEETITWTFPDLGVDETVGGGDDDKDSANSAVKLTTNGTRGLWLLGNFGPSSPYRTVGTPLNKVSVTIVHSTI